MGISMRRTAGLAVVGSLLLVLLLSGCTLTGAPPAPLTQAGDTGLGPSTQEQGVATSTPLSLPPTPTSAPRIDIFLTQTAQALEPGGATPSGLGPGILTPNPTEPGGVVLPPTTAPGVQPTVAPTVAVTPGAPQPGTPTTSGNCPATVTVQPGETLFRIALRYGITVGELAAANNISNPSLIQAGMVLKIPHCGTGTGAGATTTGERTHVVQQGENLFRIALQYNMSWEDLAEYNGITNPDAIYPGQVLRIPPSG